MAQINPTSSAAWLRLRQVALLAPSLPALEIQLRDIFGVQVCHRDPAVAEFGLINMLLPFGNQFLEIVAPTTPDCAGARHLARHGPGGYMVITQCREHAPYRQRVEALGIRVVHAFERPDFINMQLHPRDTGGTFLEIDEQRGPDAHEHDGPWMPAGDNWHARGGVSDVLGICGADIACDDPRAVAARWTAITACELSSRNGMPVLQLANAELRFRRCASGQAERLAAIELSVKSSTRIIQAAQRLGVMSGRNELMLGGIRMVL